MTRGRFVTLGVFVLLALEATMRFVYAELPSLSVELAPFRPSERPAVVSPGPDVVLCRDEERVHGAAPPMGWTRSFQGTPPEQTVYVVGDSAALGAGVEPEETYAYHLAARLHADAGRAVRLINLGFNAAGYCGYLRELHNHLDRRKADLVVLQVFADDLEQKAVMLTGGVLRADPDRLTNPVSRVALSKVYVANYLWWKGLEWAADWTTDGGTRLPPWVARGPRFIQPETLNNFGRSMAHLRERLSGSNTALVSFVLSPAGWSLCLPDADLTSECGWLRTDLEQMTHRLDAVGMPWLDLRQIWGQDTSAVQEREMGFYQDQGRLPVHPNAEGHARIAGILWPSAANVMGKRRQDAGGSLR